MRKTTIKLNVEKKDCPSAEQMTHLKLVNQDIKAVEFNAENRILQIYHVCNNESLLNCLELLALEISVLSINKVPRA